MFVGEVRWAVIYAMRNRVSHGYFEVDLNVVWNTIVNDVPDRQRVNADPFLLK